MNTKRMLLGVVAAMVMVFVTVALYVRLSVRCEELDAPAELLDHPAGVLGHAAPPRGCRCSRPCVGAASCT